MAVDPNIELAREIGAFAYDPVRHAKFAFPWGEPGMLEGEPGPRNWQKGVMATIRDHLADPETRYTPCRIAVASGHGVGKALAHGEPVLTPLGWKPIEEVRIGDEVITADGQPTRVRAVYPQGERALFRVTLDDGCSVVADGEHQWLTSIRNNRKGGQRDRIHTVKTTREIASTLRFKNGPREGLNHQLPTLEPVDHPRAALPIDPYIFGAWLGDGDAAGRITGEQDGMDELLAVGAELGRPQRKVNADGSLNRASTCGLLGVQPALRALGVFGCRAHEKWIPECYMRASISQRVALLQGLLDTDGTVGANNCVQFDVTAPRLADGISELVRSLGGVARRGEKWGSYSGKRCRRVYRCNLSLPRSVAPFRLPRKVARYQPNWGNKNCDRTRRRHIASVEPIGRGLATCIAVEHPSHLFVTRDHIVTHNSAEIAMVSKWALDCWTGARVVITANTEQQLITKTSPEVAKWHNLAITRDWFKRATMKISANEAPDNWRLDFVTWSENNTEAFAGLHNIGKIILIIYDEASNIADKVWEVTEGALTDEGTVIIWLAFGNPTRNTGRFRETFGKHRHLWYTLQLDSRTVEGTNKDYLNEIIDTYGEDSDIARVRVKGQFPSASSMQFISSAMVQAARNRVLDPLPTDPLIYGLDCARYGDDSSVLARRIGRDARSKPWKRWHGVDAMTLAGEVARMAEIDKPDAIFVDAGNIGAAVVDRLRQLEVPNVIEVWFGGKGKDVEMPGNIRYRVANKRTEMWVRMRNWLEGGSIPDEQIIEDDMIGIEYGYGRDETTLTLEKKEHAKARGLASPDNADALACTFAEVVMPRPLPGYLEKAARGRSDNSEPDVYADLYR